VHAILAIEDNLNIQMRNQVELCLPIKVCVTLIIKALRSLRDILIDQKHKKIHQTTVWQAITAAC